MWSDNESDIDYLNFGETAGQIVRLIRDPTLLPIAVGVFGGWGAGKSTLLNLTQELLGAEQIPDGAQRFVVVRFDAWLFQSYEDARTALTETIAKELLHQVAANKTLTAKATSLLKRIKWLKLAAKGVEWGVSAAVGMPLPIQALLQSAQSVLTGNGTSDDADEIKGAATDAKDTAGALLNANEVRSVPDEIAAMRREFSELLKELNVVLIVFIDNLDRCLPSRAIETLEAIRLVLFLPRTAFVIAADEDMVRHAVRKHYEGPMERHVKDYLDKLIQVPIRVPLPGVLEVQAYISQLLLGVSGTKDEIRRAVGKACTDHLRTAWKQNGRLRESIEAVASGLTSTQHNDLVLAERLAPVLAQSPEILGNPRIVKRLFNTIRLRSELAKSREMPLDEPVLAKLAVFERCAGEDAYNHMCVLISQADYGKVALLQSIEGSVATPEKLQEILPDAWKPSSAFIQQWAALPPALSTVDLRGALYLSRSSFALRSVANGLDDVEQKALAALSSVASVNSPAAKSVATELQPRQALRVIDELINALRRHEDWQQIPGGFHGCIILSDIHAPAGQRLAGYIRSLGVTPKWMSPMMKTKMWFKAA